ncbi:hypothetical protein EJ04DRAFT_562374 [Polyplosphaeria fusca]|uniref:Uncharacterized protein n=1 Tax=Polyplosphaeria fusca TaxID=682080 RepID=A0A9P4R0S4_9PLEO|nr:hypothetical protein EJ04DRAFT_562374 [Polyplosphaeria fusca]
MKAFTTLTLFSFYAITALAVGSCPGNEQQVSDNQGHRQCCPGTLTSCDGNKTCCCIQDGCSGSDCKVNGTCKAKVALDDSDFSSKVSSATGSGETASATATATGAAQNTGAAGMNEVSLAAIAGLTGVAGIMNTI